MTAVTFFSVNALSSPMSCPLPAPHPPTILHLETQNNLSVQFIQLGSNSVKTKSRQLFDLIDW